MHDTCAPLTMGVQEHEPGAAAITGGAAGGVCAHLDAVVVEQRVLRIHLPQRKQTITTLNTASSMRQAMLAHLRW